jgi:hypothetical protein
MDTNCTALCMLRFRDFAVSSMCPNSADSFIKSLGRVCFCYHMQSVLLLPCMQLLKYRHFDKPSHTVLILG